MDISLRPMRADEFETYLDYFIPDYAAEISTNYGLSPDEARSKAIGEINKSLAQGVETKDQILICITHSDTVIGYLWYKPDQIARSVFINDICILPQYRKKGYAKHALGLFETMLADNGFEQIGLRVAADNDRAHRLYQKGGFRATGINMIKQIGND
ncbi:GNAT family N-acetyltransferase [Profundibacter sp.]